MSLTEIAHELRISLRSLRRTPSYTITAILTLAVGVGATTAVFSVLNGVLLRPPPYRDAQRLVTVFEHRADGAFRLPSYLTVRDWQADSATLRSVVDGMAYIRGRSAIYETQNGPERLLIGYVTPGFFSVLGASAFRGRTFLSDEEKHGGASVAVIAHSLWLQRFGGDPSVIGRTIDLDHEPVTIIGVMPRGVVYPSWAQLWRPIAAIEGSDQGLELRGHNTDSRTIFRLRAGIDSLRATAAMRPIEARLAIAYPKESGGWSGVDVQRIGDEIIGGVRPAILVATAAVVLVLLLACANVAGLTLVRASARARELAIRAALGAGRGRLVRQIVVETALLGVVAGALGIATANAIVGAVTRAAATQLPRVDEVSVDGAALLAGLTSILFVVLLAGVIPALRASRPSLVEGLRGSGRGSAAGSVMSVRLRKVLVAAQFAFALLLLVGAGLLLQSFRRMLAVPLNFEPAGVVASGLEPPREKYPTPQDAAALYRRIVDRVRAVPGVESVGMVNHAPFGNGFAVTSVDVDGAPAAPINSGGNTALYRTADDGYLSTMAMRLVQGRWFAPDDMRSPSAFVVNEAFARRYLQGRSALGQRLTAHRASQGRKDFGEPITERVIGVVADVHQFGLDQPAAPELFVPATLEVWPWMTLVVRARGAERLVPALRRAVLDVEPAIPVGGNLLFGGFELLDHRLEQTAAQRTFITTLLGIFAACALLLAAIGMYGVTAYTVAQRTQEVGVRTALGATQRAIMRLVLGEGARVALAGAVVGLAAAFSSTRLLRSILFETAPTDVTTLVVTPIVLAIAALAANWIPARRAARVDPVVALRAE